MTVFSGLQINAPADIIGAAFPINGRTCPCCDLEQPSVMFYGTAHNCIGCSWECRTAPGCKLGEFV